MTSDGHGRTLLVCQGTGCVSSKSPEIQKALQEKAAALGLGGQVTVKLTGCHGFCEQGPLVAVEPDGILYTRVTVESAAEIVTEHLWGGRPVERLFYRNPATGARLPYYRDIPFYARQARFILRNCGHINPEVIDEYIAVGGYAALRKALKEMTPEQVLKEITDSGLRGRGGAGFSTGQKWTFLRQAKGQPKYIVCNADEGDPGAYMDRSLLEADPHSVIEGMVIGAYTMGAAAGFIYIRAEYPLAIRRLETALRQAEERGFLGDDICGSGMSFRIHIKQGAGAFVAGEETALIASIEGKPGRPRPRPPFPAEAGLWGKPTNINNVKTWACAPMIVSRGAAWFASMGTAKSKGTVVFSLVGKVKNSGLVEVPMGITLRSLVNDIGGGVPNGRTLKAVQTGGPSGGCIPASMMDIPVDYDSLASAGSIMGSGGMVVMDETTCMVDVAKYFLSFTQCESCGKCVPCRLGTKQMRDILARITEGHGTPEDMDTLLELAEAVKAGSLCGLGQTAPNPALTTLRYFRDEYEAHIHDKRCPALVCKALINYYIDPAKCQACLICARNCPSEAIRGAKGMAHVIDQEKCNKCGTCLEVCPPHFGAVSKVSGVPIEVPKELVPVIRRPRAPRAEARAEAGDN